MVESPVISGLDDQYIDYSTFSVPLHRSLLGPLSVLHDRAAAAGFELGLASGYRSFSRQLEIWNAKIRGDRPLLDDEGQRLEPQDLSPEELVFAILRWSALPGASRHHWGTDVDVFDLGPTRTGDYRLQLTLEETESGGVFADFHRWLDGELNESSGFFRPYTRPHGGVAPEPWHLSYGPIAGLYQRSLQKAGLRTLVEAADLALKQTVLQHFDEIFERFVWVDWQYYPASCRPA